MPALRVNGWIGQTIHRTTDISRGKEEDDWRKAAAKALKKKRESELNVKKGILDESSWVDKEQMEMEKSTNLCIYPYKTYFWTLNNDLKINHAMKNLSINNCFSNTIV